MSFLDDWNRQLQGLSGKSLRSKFRRLVRTSGLDYEVVRGMGYWVDMEGDRTFIYLDNGEVKVRGDMPRNLPKVKNVQNKPATPRLVKRPDSGQVWGYGNLLADALPYRRTEDPGEDVYLYWDLSELYIEASKKIRGPFDRPKDEINALTLAGTEMIATRVNELGVFPEKVFLNFYRNDDDEVTYGALGVGPIVQ